MVNEIDAPLVAHNEEIAGDTVFDLRLNHIWRRIVGGILFSEMEFISWQGTPSEIEAAEHFYSELVRDFYDETIGGGDVEYHGALLTTQVIMTLTTSIQVIRDLDTIGADAHDTDGYFDASFDTGFFQIPAGLGGFYLVRGSYHVSPANNAVSFTLRKGTAERAVGRSPVNTSAIVHVQTVMTLADGDNISCVGKVTTGTRNLRIDAIWDRTAQFSLVRLGDA